MEYKPAVMPRAIIFDLDNTLIDFMGSKRKNCEAAIKAMIVAGLKEDPDHAMDLLFQLYNKSKHGMEDNKIFQTFLKETIGRIDYRILAAGIVAYRAQREIKSYSGVIETLEKLHQRYKLAILSDAPRLKAWVRLVTIGVDSYFDKVICREDTRRTKLKLAPFRRIARELNVRPEECLMVGDNISRDIVNGRKAGMKTCFAKYGNPSASAPEADYVIEDIAELLRILR